MDPLLLEGGQDFNLSSCVLAETLECVLDPNISANTNWV